MHSTGPNHRSQEELRRPRNKRVYKGGHYDQRCRDFGHFWLQTVDVNVTVCGNCDTQRHVVPLPVTRCQQERLWPISGCRIHKWRIRYTEQGDPGFDVLGCTCCGRLMVEQNAF